MFRQNLPPFGGHALDPAISSRLDSLELELQRYRSMQAAEMQAKYCQPSLLPPLEVPQPPLPLMPASHMGPAAAAAHMQQQAEEQAQHRELMAAHRDLLRMLQQHHEDYNALAKNHTELIRAHHQIVSQSVAPGAAPSAAATPRPPPGPRGDSQRLIRAKTRYHISNDIGQVAPKEPTLLDNTLLFLPTRAVHEFGIEPNMNDKGDKHKDMWFGRVWELRNLRAALYTEKLRMSKQEAKPISEARRRELDVKMKTPSVEKLLRRLAARWKGAAFRSRCSLSVLDGLRFSNMRGTLVYAHGSGGCSWDNFRICRMIAGMGILVIAPDGFAYPKNSAMGQMRHKDIQPLHKAQDDVDYWANDLLYTSSAFGTFNYSTKAATVLQKPNEYRELYEKCYQLRRSELHFIMRRLPDWVKSHGVFLGGTSEGAMTVARFDDQRYGEMICGRFINSFSIEYCYFTPTPEAGQLGGQMDVPTLNIIGTKDQFFGPVDSVAKLVVEDAVTGYGDRNLTGNGYRTMVRQGVDVGLVCVLENGVHSPCNTHDNFLRQLFSTFFSRPGSIWELHEIWKVNPTMKDIAQLVETTAKGDGTKGMNVTHLFVPTMKFPNRMSLREVEALRSIRAQSQLDAAMAAENRIIQKEQDEIKEHLDRVRQETSRVRGSFLTVGDSKNYYSKDKVHKVTSGGIANKRKVA